MVSIHLSMKKNTNIKRVDNIRSGKITSRKKIMRRNNPCILIHSFPNAFIVQRKKNRLLVLLNLFPKGSFYKKRMAVLDKKKILAISTI